MLKSRHFERLVILAIAIALVASVATTAYSTDEKKHAGSALLLDPSKVVERPPVEMEFTHNPAGSEMFVAPLTIPVICDGSIDAAEWADAYMYDISDTTGQEDGIADPLGTVFLWLKQDDNGVYFAIRNNADQILDEYDQCGLYFDDNHDGCWPASATNEGNNWLVYSAAGNFVAWRWWQDYDCGFPPNYVCTYDNVLYAYNWTPACFGIGIGPTGVVDYEVMIPYGVIDEYLDLTMPPDSLGFFMYCLDNGPVSFNGEWPSQHYATTYNEPCYYGHLICGEEEEWPDHKMHFPQLPDLEGWDVYAVFPKTLADDWQCSQTGWVTDIHFWGSWRYDWVYTDYPFFILSIHENLPVGHPDNPYPWSIPGDTLWWWEGEVPGIPFDPPTVQHWYNPNEDTFYCNDHQAYWRYDFVGIDSFFQYKDSIYWLNISALNIPPPYEWGWKTSRDHFMDDAVYTDTPPEGPWFEMYEPPRCNFFSVYFDIPGLPPQDYGSTNYYGQGWYFYEMEEWWNMWFYNNPFTWDRPKLIWMEFYIEPMGGPYEFALNWSTPDWDELEMGRPPLPEDGDEYLYIGREYFTVVPGYNYIEYFIPYNPEWVSIDFRGFLFFADGGIWHECDSTSMDLAFVITGREVEPEESLYWKPDQPDYAPSGMPDIDQKQDNWWKDYSGNWTFCGPVAVANCFMWFDAKYNVPAGAPGDGNDQFPLVRDYLDALGPFIPPNTDDHDPWNVDHAGTPWLFGATPPPPATPQPFVPGPQPQPSGMPPWGELVERLAWYFDTDGVRTGYCAFSGTYVDDMQDGIDQWFRDEGVDDILCEVTTAMPTFAYVESLVEKCEDVILLLGFWFEATPGEWYREGGHYVTVAGINSEQSLIAFSDPYYDNAEAGGRGRVRNGALIPHAPVPGHGATVHNDVGNVSHDIYSIVDPSPSPGGLWAIDGYPPGGKSSLSDWMSNFYNQNVPDEFRSVTAQWDQRQPLHTEVEYCVHISPWEYRGDANGDGIVNSADVVYLINYLFKGDPPPDPLSEGDVNCDGIINSADVVFLINYLFKGGPPPRCCDP